MKAYTVNGLRHMFDRAVRRAGILPAEDVTLHTLRHTAISRMIAEGHNDHTVMAVVGHSSGRMLERYTHPTEEHKVGALESFSAVPVDTNLAQTPDRAPVRTKREVETSRCRALYCGPPLPRCGFGVTPTSRGCRVSDAPA